MPSDLENDSDYDENVQLFECSEMSNRINVDEAKFYDLFGPFFKKWSIYSHKKGILLLGDNKCSENYVKKFYETWRNFKSWRLFLHCEEIKDNVFDINSAENNKEKKWMMKERKAGKPWSGEELNLLVKAVGRFPG